MKRLFDVVMSAFGVMALSPIFAAVAAAIWVTDGRPFLFRQERVGVGGRTFRIFKFRTMVRDAHKRGRQITVGGDPRVTALGQFLRKTKLDELPQLFNVFLGDMSFVGPRPQVPFYVEIYTEEQLKVLQYKPGITDVASIIYCDEGEILAAAEDPDGHYINVVLPDKIRLNLEYAARATIFSDIKILVQTVIRLLSPHRLRRPKPAITGAPAQNVPAQKRAA